MATANYPQRISVATSTEFECTPSYKRFSVQKVVSYNNIIKREIQEILQDDRQSFSRTARPSRTLTRPSVFVTDDDDYSDDDCTSGGYQGQGSRLQLLPHESSRRHSCSSIRSNDTALSDTLDNFQRSYGQFRTHNGYSSGNFQ